MFFPKHLVWQPVRVPRKIYTLVKELAKILVKTLVKTLAKMLVKNLVKTLASFDGKTGIV